SHSRSRTGRAILKDFDGSKAVRIQLSSSKDFASADMRRRRARPATSLIAKNKKPAVQTSRATLANLPSRGDAAPASTIMAGSVGDPLSAATAWAGPRRPAAFPSAAECHAGSSSESNGSVSEPRIPAAHARCRNAEDRWRAALAMTHVKASKIVVFAEHPIRKASETSELPGRFIVSSPCAPVKPARCSECKNHTNVK